MTATNERLIVLSHAHNRTFQGWRKDRGALQKQLEAEKKEVVTLSAANEAKDREIGLLQEKTEGPGYDEFYDETHQTSTGKVSDIKTCRFCQF